MAGRIFEPIKGDAEDEDSMFFLDSGIHLQDYTVS
jgi:hypothetical protein